MSLFFGFLSSLLLHIIPKLNAKRNEKIIMTKRAYSLDEILPSVGGGLNKVNIMFPTKKKRLNVLVWFLKIYNYIQEIRFETLNAQWLH